MRRRTRDAPDRSADDLGELTYLKAPLEDGEELPAPLLLDHLTSLVVDVLGEGRRVLVHCSRGKNRSGLLMELVVLGRTGSSTASRSSGWSRRSSTTCAGRRQVVQAAQRAADAAPAGRAARLRASRARASTGWVWTHPRIGRIGRIGRTARWLREGITVRRGLSG